MKISQVYSYVLIGIVSLSMALTSCGKKSEDEFGDEGESGGGKTAQPAAVDAASAATITGKISFEGAAPAATTTDVSSDPVCATKANAEPAEVTQEVVVSDGKLANVFIYVSGGLEG